MSTTEEDVREDTKTEDPTLSAEDLAALGAIHLRDKDGKAIEIHQLRGKTTGEVFISTDLEDLPAQDARFEMTVRGVAGSKYEFEDKGGHWTAYVKLTITERLGFRILDPVADPDEPDLFEDERWNEVEDKLRAETSFLVDDIQASIVDARDLEWAPNDLLELAVNADRVQGSQLMLAAAVELEAIRRQP